MKVDVVIPFIEGPRNSVELRYALRSIAKNLRGDVVVWLYGDQPEWVQGVNHIPVVREPKERYAKFFNQNQKIEFACLNPEIEYRFIYTYDDIYFLKPIGLDVLNRPRALEDMNGIPEKHWFLRSNAGRFWKQCMKETLQCLRYEGLPLYNYETHLPRVYNKEMALAILKKYNSREHAFQFATMYFNNYVTDPELLKANKFFKLGIYHPVGFKEMLSLAEKSEVMNVAKATDDSLRVLEVLFPEKSGYER